MAEQLWYDVRRAWWYAWIAILAVASTASQVQAQIDVPKEVEPHTKIVATLESGVPEDAEVKADWSIPESIEFEQVGDRMLIWAPPGKHSLGVSLIWVQFEELEIEVGGEPRTIKSLIDFGQERHSASFTVLGREPDEPDEPDPDDPDPDVPADDFDNLGQRVAVWAKGLEGRGTAAGVYRNAATALRGDPSRTQNDVAADVVAGLKSGINYESYASLRANINADLQQRWAVSPLSRGVMADYYDAIANGLEAAQ